MAYFLQEVGSFEFLRDRRVYTLGDAMDPWENEPNFMKLAMPFQGYAGVIKRNSFGGLNGYVGIPEGHPLFGVGYTEGHPVLNRYLDLYKEKEFPVDSFPLMTLLGASGGETITVEEAIRVHGGVTFAAGAIYLEYGKYVAEEKLWWFGFDTSHGGDFIPMMPELSPEVQQAIEDFVDSLFGEYTKVGKEARENIYRDVVYTEQQLHEMAQQLHEIQFLGQSTLGIKEYL